MAAPLNVEQAVRLAGYTVVGPAIHGGMSTVYPARRMVAGDGSDTSQPDTAIKVLHDNADFGRLQREADLLRSADHAAIARFVDVGELATGAAFLASQWVPGKTLHAHLIDHDRFELTDGLAIFDAIADGLQHLHDRGIVHRDLSPSNIILGADQADRAVTLIDFGISRGEASTYRTIGTDLAGTPRYLAPEVISGDEPNPASDQFAAAIVLYEMLTGSWPYPESPTAANALHHQLSTAPTPLIERIHGAPASLDQALQRALHKDPAQRFSSMDDLVDAIRRPAPKTSSNWQRPFAAAAVVAVGLAALLLTASLVTGNNSEAAAPPTSIVAARTVGGDWSAGDAAALDCNLLDFTDFDDRVLPRNWYLNPIDEAGVDVVEFGGQDNSPALRVGLGDRYGLWGEEVPIEPGQDYVFAGTFITEGAPAVADFTVEWYDADNNGLLIESRTVDLNAVANGRVSLATTAPTDARFAVTRVFKDASDGSLLVDELVLARADDPCVERL